MDEVDGFDKLLKEGGSPKTVESPDGGSDHFPKLEAILAQKRPSPKPVQRPEPALLDEEKLKTAAAEIKDAVCAQLVEEGYPKEVMEGVQEHYGYKREDIAKRIEVEIKTNRPNGKYELVFDGPPFEATYMKLTKRLDAVEGKANTFRGQKPGEQYRDCYSCKEYWAASFEDILAGLNSVLSEKNQIKTDPYIGH